MQHYLLVFLFVVQTLSLKAYADGPDANKNILTDGENSIVTPNQFKKGSDSERIEQAIQQALKLGVNAVHIPRFDKLNKKAIWLIDKAITLPSDFTLYLDDCRIRLAPGTQDNLITNSGARIEPLSQNQNINIIGKGNVVLCGGLETHFHPPGDLSGYRTIGILLNETRNFTLEGITLEETQGWAILAQGCAFGKISDINFNNSGKYPNQDGLDLNCCHDILIENITGQTGDDLIALVGSRSDEPLTRPILNGTATQRMTVGSTGKQTDENIYNISISNVKGTSIGGCAIVRLLNMDGAKMYNIFINNVLDTSEGGTKANSNAIVIGDVRYWTVRQPLLGETSRIFVNNFVSSAKVVIQIRGSLTNSVFSNIYYDANNKLVEYFDMDQVKNVKVDGQKM